jgi:cell wall-associated NlpC family hydrolase
MSWAHAYVGLPFAPFGLGPRAYNCWGLVRQVLADRHGINVPPYGDLGADDLAGIADRMGAPPLEWSEVARPRAFDVMLAAQRPASVVPLHCGIMVDARRVLHIAEATNACVMALDHPHLAGRVLGFWRHRDIAREVAA